MTWGGDDGEVAGLGVVWGRVVRCLIWVLGLLAGDCMSVPSLSRPSTVKTWVLTVVACWWGRVSWARRWVVSLPLTVRTVAMGMSAVAR